MFTDKLLGMLAKERIFYGKKYTLVGVMVTLVFIFASYHVSMFFRYLWFDVFDLGDGRC